MLKLKVALTLCWLQYSACQPSLQTNTVQNTIVYRPLGLGLAMSDPTVGGIALAGNMTIDPTQWPSTGAILLPGRTLIIYPQNNASSTGLTINFSGLEGAIKVRNGAFLAFVGLSLTNAAYKPWTDSNDTYLIDAALAALPSIETEPNATLVFSNTMQDFYPAYSTENCSNFTRRVVTGLQQLSGVSADLSEVDNTTFMLSGANYIAATASANITGPANTYNLTLLSSRASCMEYVPPKGANKGFPWWGGLILGLGVAAILAALIAAGVVLLRRRRRGRSAAAVKAAQSRGPDNLEVSNPLHDSTPFTVSSVATPDDSAMVVPKFNSAPDTGEVKAGLPPQLVTTLTAPPAVYHSKPPLGSGGNHRDHPEAALGSAIQRLPTSGNEMGSSAGSVPSQRTSRMSAGAPPMSMPELFRQRSHMPLDEVELGPLLGRGAYGRVFKARWKGALVAVKVIDHGKQDSSSAVDIARESSLATSVVHPNVVSTYKVVTVNASRHASNPQQPYSLSPGQPSPSPEPAQPIDEELHGHSDDFREELQTWLLLEFCDRGNLERACDQQRFMNKLDKTPDMVSIYRTLLDIAAGMDYLHSAGVMHGDLKGANVLLKSTATDPRGFQCKLADFGLSRMLDLDMTHISTHTYGTISYMPPELLSQGKMTRAADVYSFGMLMWEMYTGMSLFKGLTVGQVFFMVVYEHHRPAIPDTCPEALADCMRACWSADPADRPTFEQITKDLNSMYKSHQKAKPLEGASSAPLGSRTGSAKGDLLASSSMRVRSATAGAPGNLDPALALPSLRPAIAPSKISEGHERSSGGTTSTAAARSQSQQLSSDAQQGQKSSDTASTAAAASSFQQLISGAHQQLLPGTASTSAQSPAVHQAPDPSSEPASGSALPASLLQHPPSEAWHGSVSSSTAAASPQQQAPFEVAQGQILQSPAAVVSPFQHNLPQVQHQQQTSGTLSAGASPFQQPALDAQQQTSGSLAAGASPLQEPASDAQQGLILSNPASTTAVPSPFQQLLPDIPPVPREQ